MSVLSMHKSNGQEDGAQLIIVSLMTLKGHKFETLEKQETSRFQKKKPQDFKSITTMKLLRVKLSMKRK